MKIIVEAPARFIVSGMGDVLATWFEAESCKAKYAGNMTGGVGSQSLTGYSRIVNFDPQLLDRHETLIFEPSVGHAGLIFPHSVHVFSS